MGGPRHGAVFGLLGVLLLIPTAAAQSDAPSAALPGWLYWTMPLLVSTILLLIGALVLVKGQPVIYNTVFFLLCAASSLKGYTEAVLFFLLQHGGSGSLFEGARCAEEKEDGVVDH